MGFRNNAYAKIWEKEDKGSYSVVSLSISHKTKDGDYVVDFNDRFVRFYGPAAEALKAVKEGDRIQLKSVDVTNHYDKEAKKQYVNYIVYGFDVPGEYKPNQNKKHTQSGTANIQGDAVDSVDDLPF